jgi:hypothetical protein
MRITHPQSCVFYLAPQIFIRRICVNACCLQAGVPKQSLNDIHRNAGQRQMAAASVVPQPMNGSAFKRFSFNAPIVIFKRLREVAKK